MHFSKMQLVSHCYTAVLCELISKLYIIEKRDYRTASVHQENPTEISSGRYFIHFNKYKNLTIETWEDYFYIEIFVF